jgi:hypothetical protein
MPAKAQAKRSMKSDFDFDPDPDIQKQKTHFHTNESKKLFTFCALDSSAREINSRLLHARVPL